MSGCGQHEVESIVAIHSRKHLLRERTLVIESKREKRGKEKERKRERESKRESERERERAETERERREEKREKEKQVYAKERRRGNRVENLACGTRFCK